MTDRLYYSDPYLQAFDATVTRVAARDNQLTVTLDRTAFYPTSGGQPFDTGTLDAGRVVDVFDADDGTVSHVVEPASGKPGDVLPHFEPGLAVHGSIDWGRRFDHMQQHTGQHVLSAAFDRLFGVATVSFHLGADTATIDLARETTPADIAAAESEANRVVWEDRPVSIRFVSAEEAARLPLRKAPARDGALRLIDVHDFDLSACGGTHVARTGGIGLIAVARWERFKGGQRIEFVCGRRALDAFRSLRDAMSASVRIASALPGELPAAIERLQTDAKEQKRTIVGLQNELAKHRAEELAAAAETAAGTRLVVRAIEGDANMLKSLATAICARPGFVVVLVSTSAPALVAVARSQDTAGVSAQDVLARLVSAFGGRGGGRPDFAQGGGLAGSPEAIVEAARAAVLGA